MTSWMYLNNDNFKSKFFFVFGSFAIDYSIFSLKGKCDLEENLESIRMIYPENGKTTDVMLLDFYNKNKNMIENFEKYKEQWAKKGETFFKEKMNYFRFVKDVFDFIDNFDEFKKKTDNLIFFVKENADE